jgi:hypothetical protein
MRIELAVLAGATMIAASILYIERYQISAVAYGYTEGDDKTGTSDEAVYRLDRWTGQLEYCSLGGQDPPGYFARAAGTGHATFECGFPHKNP